jgi:hypothetical protein
MKVRIDSAIKKAVKGDITPATTIRVKRETHERLSQLVKFGHTMNDVIEMLLDQSSFLDT